jgi:chemotaxis protein MotB
VPRRKKVEEDDGLTGNEWLATFSDTMTLLLTFFILLYSFSTVDASKFKQIAAALQSVLTGKSGDSIIDYNMNYGDVPLEGENSDKSDVPIDKGKEPDTMYEKVKEFVEKNKLDAVVSIKADSRGVIIELRDSVLFDSGSASIKEESKPILEKISGLIATFTNEINVEGHTDNRPIKNYKFESNWELSTARAGCVLRYFVDAKGVNPSRFKASGYGEFRPLVPNDSDEHRALNRRVSILIVANEKESGKK